MKQVQVIVTAAFKATKFCCCENTCASYLISRKNTSLYSSGKFLNACELYCYIFTLSRSQIEFLQLLKQCCVRMPLLVHPSFLLALKRQQRLLPQTPIQTLQSIQLSPCFWEHIWIITTHPLNPIRPSIQYSSPLSQLPRV